MVDSSETEECEILDGVGADGHWGCGTSTIESDFVTASDNDWLPNGKIKANYYEHYTVTSTSMIRCGPTLATS